MEFVTDSNMKNIEIDDIKSVLFGVAIGDALGVPVEFKSRQTLQQNPVTDMMGYGTYNQPPGTFSDDSSLTFCLAEALTEDFDLNNIAQKFVAWARDGYWTAGGYVFDIGSATSSAIRRLQDGVPPNLAGGTDESDNGNGSLMRIALLLFHIWDKPIDERFRITQQVSAITHGHIRSVIACFYYLEFARLLLHKKDKFEIYETLQIDLLEYLLSRSIHQDEIKLFHRLLVHNIHHFSEERISSSGYVIDTLETSIWCLLTTDTYREAVLKAVNLGHDTDTTAAVTGGLAGLLYGYENIPKEWRKKIARRKDIERLAERIGNKYQNLFC